MKLIKKQFGITAIIAVIGFLFLPLTGYPQNVNAIDMVSIPAGTFMMGSPTTEPKRDNDETQHSVTLSGFKMSKYQVTQEQYQAVMGSNPSYFNSIITGGSVALGKLPVDGVSWHDAVVFCNKSSIKDGLNPVYSIGGKTNPADWGTLPTSSNAKWDAVVMDKSKNGYRLPTEAEWEYACRAGTTTPFNTGNNITTDQANYDGDYPYNGNSDGINREKTMPVGSFEPNAWGLYDMHGNIMEWCWDWYGEYSSDTQIDPLGASSGTQRVGRGGSFYNTASGLRSADRWKASHYRQYNTYGIRLVRSKYGSCFIIIYFV